MPRSGAKSNQVCSQPIIEDSGCLCSGLLSCEASPMWVRLPEPLCITPKGLVCMWVEGEETRRRLCKHEALNQMESQAGIGESKKRCAITMPFVSDPGVSCLLPASIHLRKNFRHFTIFDMPLAKLSKFLGTEFCLGPLSRGWGLSHFSKCQGCEANVLIPL